MSLDLAHLDLRDALDLAAIDLHAHARRVYSDQGENGRSDSLSTS